MKALLLSALALPAALAPMAFGPHEVDARSEYRRLTKEYAGVMKEYERDLEKMKVELGEQELAEYEADWNPNHSYVEVFAEAAANYAGTDDAVQFLDWIVRNALMDGDRLSAPCEAALGTLIADHLESRGLRSFVSSAGYLTYQMPVEKIALILQRVIDSGHASLTLAALFSRGVAFADVGREAEAKADFQKVMELDTEGGMSKQAKGYLFEMENLKIGKVAPDIEGPDLDGVSFRLSDYRGKVVFLDFWGDW